jgi:ketosteroid isomerase-like protein
MLAMAKFTGLKLHTEDVQVVGDIGIETGTYEQTLAPKGKTLHDTGNYLAVWKKQAAGGWKLYRLAYDSELPAPKS